MSMFLKIGTLLDPSMKRAGIKKSVETARALKRAEDILKALHGDEIVDSVRPVYIRYKTLTFACIDSAQSATVGPDEKEILEYVNKGFPYKVVERLCIVS